MMEKRNGIYYFISTVIAIFAIVCWIIYTIYMHYSYYLNETIFSGYVSGYGSFLGGTLGGIIGALVAFGVARLQLNADYKKSLKQDVRRFYNILRALSCELKHNKEILILITKNQEKKDSYIKQLEVDIWNEVRFDASSYISTTLYEILDDYYRECKDMKSNALEEYKSGSVDFLVRIQTIDKMLRLIEEIQNTNRAKLGIKL